MTAADLKALRKKLGLTQEALAERIGVTRHSVKRWEMGVYAISENREKTLMMLKKIMNRKRTPR